MENVIHAIFLFLIPTNFTAWISAMVKWSNDAHVKYLKKGSLKLFVFDVILLCVLACAGIFFNLILCLKFGG